MIADQMRIIFRAEPTEQIVKIEPYRDRLMIATTERILEWNPDREEIQMLEFSTYPNDNPNMVAAYHRARPLGF